MKRYRNALIFILLPLLCITAALLFGRYSISLRDVLRALFRPELTEAVNTRVVWYLRLPRAIAAAMCGAALAVSGAAFQGVFRNPLVNSGLLGVSNGAGFGACAAIIFLGGGAYTYVLAFAFALLAVVLSYFSGRVSGVTTAISLVRERRKVPGDVREDG